MVVMKKNGYLYGYVHGDNGISSGCSPSHSVAATMTKIVLTAITITNDTKEKLLVFIPRRSFQVPVTEEHKWQRRSQNPKENKGNDNKRRIKQK